MAKNSGGTRRTSSGQGYRTGPGFTEPIKGPISPPSSQTEIQYVYVDKLTGINLTVTKTLTQLKQRLKELKKKTKELVLTRRTAIALKELKISKVAVAQNIDTLVNNKVKHGRKTYS